MQFLFLLNVLFFWHKSEVSIYNTQPINIIFILGNYIERPVHDMSVHRIEPVKRPKTFPKGAGNHSLERVEMLLENRAMLRS